MKIDVINIENGTKIREIELPESIYALEMNEPVLHSVVKAYQANSRQGTHATKTRSTVAGSGKKPYRQKGTGNARQGCTRSPLLPGGATSHGPQPRDYRQKLNLKVKNLAIRVALSDKYRHKKLIVVDDYACKDYSTKKVVKILQTLKVDATSNLLADERKDDFLFRSARNIYRTEAVNSTQMSVLDILKHEYLIMSETALAALQQRIERKNP